MKGICPRCKGNNIHDDLCIICGAYVAPHETLVFVRTGEEPLPPGRPAGKRNEEEERETARLAHYIHNKAYLARHSNDPAFIERRRARERDRYTRRKDNPAYKEYRRKYCREWAARKKLEREAANVASA